MISVIEHSEGYFAHCSVYEINGATVMFFRLGITEVIVVSTHKRSHPLLGVVYY